MKQRIGNKRYDTDRATAVASHGQQCVDYKFGNSLTSTIIYRTRAGNWFVVQEGIFLGELTPAKAIQWLTDRGNFNELRRYFPSLFCEAKKPEPVADAINTIGGQVEQPMTEPHQSSPCAERVSETAAAAIGQEAPIAQKQTANRENKSVGRPMTEKENRLFLKKRAQMVLNGDSLINGSGSRNCAPVELSNAIIDGIWLAIDHGAYEAFDEKGDGSIAFRKPIKLDKLDVEEREHYLETLATIQNSKFPD